MLRDLEILLPTKKALVAFGELAPAPLNPASTTGPEGKEFWGESAVAQIPACELTHSRALVASLPRPSGQQIDNFVEFVSEAHSWYKHLPLLPPGVPFRFFIDPTSGFDRVVGAGGRVRQVERTEQSQKFHYTWMTTADYRTRFGHLAYDAQAGMRMVMPAFIRMVRPS